MNHLEELLLARPLPPASGDKRDRGNVLLVAGGAHCPGAAVLAGSAALRAGAGRVQLAVDPSVRAAVGAAFPEAFVLGWDEHELLAARAGGAAALVIGPGLEPGSREVVLRGAAAAGAGVPVVLDAAALDAVDDLDGARVVLAPNESEAVALLGRGGDVASLARALVERRGAAVAVRGVTTVVADQGGGCWAGSSSAAGLGTAGSGDVFAGVLGGLLARGGDDLTALAWAVAVHARAGELAAADVGDPGFLAGDVAERVPAALAGYAPNVREPLPEERAAGTDDARRQAEAILAESEERIAEREPLERRRSEDVVEPQ
jgi:hydroxyethylthiazole kinase-like uncharacterized protein yjeF